MEGIRKTRPATGPVHYRGDAFAPASRTYPIVSMRAINLTTQNDSGYAPSAVDRIADLGVVAPLALAALWEAAFAFEAGPLSTWSN